MTVDKTNPTPASDAADNVDDTVSLMVPEHEAGADIVTTRDANEISAALSKSEAASQTSTDDRGDKHSWFGDIDVIEYRIIQERLARSRKVRALLDIADMAGYSGSFGTNLIVGDKNDRTLVEVNDDVEATLVRLYDQLADLPTVKTVEHLEHRLNTDGTVPVALRLARAQKVSSLLEVAAFMGHNKNSKLFIKDDNKELVLNEKIAQNLVRVYDELADLPTKLTGEADPVQVEDVLDVEVATE